MKDGKTTYYILNYTTNTEGCCSDNHLILFDDNYKQIKEITMQSNPSYWEFNDEYLNSLFNKDGNHSTYFIGENEIIFFDNENDIISNNKKELTVYKLTIKNKGIVKTIYGNYSIKD